MEDTLCCPSKSNSSLTIMDELCPAELFMVSPDKSAHREKGQVEQVTGGTGHWQHQMLMGMQMCVNITTLKAAKQLSNYNLCYRPELL